MIAWSRVFIAALVATIVYFLYGGIIFAALPVLRREFAKYPALYRGPESMMKVFPIGIVATFIGIVAITILYAMAFGGESGFEQGARFGALIAVFAVCGFVVHNYVNLNIGMKLTVEQAIAYFIEWMLVGIAIGLVYRRPA